MVSSLLNAVIDISLLEVGYEIGLNWLGHFARVIIEGVGIVGLGIIVFNLVLKAITLPFDIYQRVSSRKQNLIMKQMQPELEKLQKQYANDKNMYNQKMLELQKKNGYSMLGACLPMIVSLVILIVAWQGFRAYAQYANLNYFVRMSENYNDAVLERGVDGVDYTLEEALTFTDGTKTEDGIVYTLYKNDAGVEYMRVESEDPADYVFYYYNLETLTVTREYQVDIDKLMTVLMNLPAEEKDELVETAIQAISAYNSDDSDANYTAMRVACQAYVVRIGATAAAEGFRENSPKFLWIKNVWYPDVSYKHPIPTYSDFKSQLNVNVTLANGEKKALASVITEAQYENLTSQLTTEQEQANGYFILIVLSIGFMLLSQLIVMKSSKEANQYQTVDGQGARSQKVMLVVMPLIYALFAFQYSAAFSIYMTMSSIVSILVTLVANFFIGKAFKKKEEAEMHQHYTRKLPWMKGGEETNTKGKARKK